MSRKPEQLLWDRLRAARPADLFMERVENLVGEGRPDVDALWRGLFTPIELKAQPQLPARDATRVFGDDGLSVEQRNWHLRWSMHGGSSLVVAQAGTLLIAWDGRRADEFNAAPLATLIRCAVCVADLRDAKQFLFQTACSRAWRGRL